MAEQQEPELANYESNRHFSRFEWFTAWKVRLPSTAMTTKGGISITNCASDFGPFGGQVWFNCAHQGPLPRAAVLAAHEALKQKANPHLIRDDDFTILPNALKASLGNLMGAAAEDANGVRRGHSDSRLSSVWFAAVARTTDSRRVFHLGGGGEMSVRHHGIGSQTETASIRGRG